MAGFSCLVSFVFFILRFLDCVVIPRLQNSVFDVYFLVGGGASIELTTASPTSDFNAAEGDTVNRQGERKDSGVSGTDTLSENIAAIKLDQKSGDTLEAQYDQGHLTTFNVTFQDDSANSLV